MTLMRMLAFTPVQNAAAPTTTGNTSAKSSKGSPSPRAATPPTSQRNATPATAVTPPVSANKTKPTQHHSPVQAPQAATQNTKPQSSGSANERWLAVVPQLGLSGLSQQIIQQCSCNEWNAQTMNLCIDSKHQPLLSPAQEKKIKDAITSVVQQKLTITISSSEQHRQLTPQKLNEQKKQHRLNQAVDQLDQDPAVNRLLGEYGASLIPNSIEAVEDHD